MRHILIKNPGFVRREVLEPQDLFAVTDINPKIKIGPWLKTLDLALPCADDPHGWGFDPADANGPLHAMRLEGNRHSTCGCQVGNLITLRARHGSRVKRSVVLIGLQGLE